MVLRGGTDTDAGDGDGDGDGAANPGGRGGVGLVGISGPTEGFKKVAPAGDAVAVAVAVALVKVVVEEVAQGGRQGCIV